MCHGTTAESQHIQKVSNCPVVDHQLEDICTRLTTDIDKARIPAASFLHSGNWLLAPPITSVGLMLSDEMIRVAVGYRLGLERVSHTLVHAPKTRTPEHFTDCHADEAAQDNSNTPSSTM